MKIEIAQVETFPGFIDRNTEITVEAVEKAKEDGANVVVTSELAIPGYASMDLFLYDDFVRMNKEAVQKIARKTKGITALVGFVDSDENKIGPDGTEVRYNAVAVMKDGEVIGKQYKTLLPEYDVFPERRYFQEAAERHVFDIDGVKIGIPICEDSWNEHYATDVSADLVRKGADVLINLSASPFYVGKKSIREAVIKGSATRLGVPVLYSNLVGSQDGYDGELVFDGQSMAYDYKGNLIGLGSAFEQDRVMVDLENQTRVENIDLPEMEQLYRALILGTKGYFKRQGFTEGILGLSGGIDSALVACIGADALGADKILAYGMPSEYSSQGSINDARDLADNLGINFILSPIQGIFEAVKKDMEEDIQKIGRIPSEEIVTLALENVQARIRGSLKLMRESNLYRKSLVLGTGNKTEMFLGYCTAFGDMATLLNIISDVDKDDVYNLSSHINKRSGREIIPNPILTKAPSAELRPNQTDEGSLGGRYKDISEIVRRMTLDRATIYELSKDFDRGLVDHIWDLYTFAEFKRRLAASGIKVSPKSIGIGRRMPMMHGFKI